MYEMVKNGEVDGCFEDIPVVGYKIASGQVDFKITLLRWCYDYSHFTKT